MLWTRWQLGTAIGWDLDANKCYAKSDSFFVSSFSSFLQPATVPRQNLPCFTALKNIISNHLALSRLWHVMNEMAAWKCDWMGSRCHFMLREDGLFFRLFFFLLFFATRDRAKTKPPLLHRVEKYNIKSTCSLTSLTCYELDGSLDLRLDGISMPFNATRSPTLFSSLFLSPLFCN